MSHWDVMHDRLVALAGEGLSATELANALSEEFRTVVSRNAVIGYCHRKSIRFGASLSPAQKDERARQLAERRKRIAAHMARQESQAVKDCAGQRLMDAAREMRASVRAEETPSPQPSPVIAEVALVAHDDRRYGPASILDVRQDQCRFIAGEPSASEPCFCGMKVRAMSSYCDTHHVVTYTRTRTPEEKQSDDARRMSALRRNIPAHLSA